MAADGSVNFDSSVNTDGFERGANSLKRAAEACAKSVEKAGHQANEAFGKSTQIASLENQIDQTRDRICRLSEEMERMEKTRVPTEEYTGLARQVETTQLKLDGLLDRQKKMEAQGVRHNSSRWKNLQYDIENTTRQLNAYQVELQDTIDRERAYTSAAESSAYSQKATDLDNLNSRLYVQQQRLQELIDKEIQSAAEAQKLQAIGESAEVSNRKIAELNQRLQELKERQKELQAAGVTWGFQEYEENAARIAEATTQLKQYTQEMLRAQQAGGLQGVNSGLAEVKVRQAQAETSGNQMWAAMNRGARISIGLINRFASTLGKTASTRMKDFKAGVKGIGKASNKATKSVLKLSNMFKLLLIRMAMRAAIQGIREGFENLAQYSGDANRTISELMSSMKYLGNSVASAFTPILTLAAPALNTLIDLLVTAVNCINQFFSALSGKTTFIKAKKVNEDYAKSLKKTGAAAGSAGKEAKKALAPFDDLIQISEKGSDSSKGGAGTDPSQMFETVAIESSISDFVSKLKALFTAGDYEGIGRFLGEKINEAVQKFTNYIEWDNVGAKITAFITAFTTIFNSLVGTIDWYAIGIMMGAGIDTLAHALYLLLTQIDWFLLGNALSQSLMGLVDKVDWSLIGATIGAFFQAQISGLLGFILGTDWGTIGKALADGLMGIIREINWEQLGYVFAAKLNAIFTVMGEFARNFEWKEFGSDLAASLSTFFQTFQWGEAGAAISDFILGLLDFMITVVKETDWGALVQGIVDFLEAVDWLGLATKLFDLFSSAIGIVFGLLANLLGTLISDGVQACAVYWQGKVDECGGSVAKGILKGIGEIFLNIQQWSIDNVSKPFMDSLLKAFGISDGYSQWLEIGRCIWEGFCNGIKIFSASPIPFIKEHMVDPFVNGIKGLLGIHSSSTVLAEIGSFAISGFNKGVTDGQSESQNVIQSWASGISTWFSNKFGINTGDSAEARRWATSIITGFNAAMTKNYKTSQQSVTLWADSIRKWFVGTDENQGVNKAAWTRFALDIITAFRDSITVNHAESMEAVQTWAQNVKVWFWGDTDLEGTGGMYAAFYDMAKRINEGFAQGISDFAYMAKDAIRRWAREAMEAAEEEFDINSPSREFHTIAEYVVKGFNAGINDMAGTSVAAAKNWLDKVMDVFDGAGAQLPIGLNIPNAAAYLPSMALGYVAPPRAGEMAAIQVGAGQVEQLAGLSYKVDTLLSALKEKDESRDTQIVLKFSGSLGALARTLKPELDKEAGRKGMKLVVVEDQG